MKERMKSEWLWIAVMRLMSGSVMPPRPRANGICSGNVGAGEEDRSRPVRRAPRGARKENAKRLVFMKCCESNGEEHERRPRRAGVGAVTYVTDNAVTYVTDTHGAHTD